MKAVRSVSGLIFLHGDVPPSQQSPTGPLLFNCVTRAPSSKTGDRDHVRLFLGPLFRCTDPLVRPFSDHRGLT